jgi:hypothetical protein
VTRRRPVALDATILVFVALGVEGLATTIGNALQGEININFLALWLLAGIGMLRLDPRARVWGLRMLWVELVFFSLLAFAYGKGPTTVDLRFFGHAIGHVPGILGAEQCAVMFLIALWRYRVLRRPDVVALFEPPLSVALRTPLQALNDVATECSAAIGQIVSTRRVSARSVGIAGVSAALVLVGWGVQLQPSHPVDSAWPFAPRAKVDSLRTVAVRSLHGVPDSIQMVGVRSVRIVYLNSPMDIPMSWRNSERGSAPR